MPERFFGRQIEVITKGGENETKIPVSFKYDGREYIITEVMEFWPDYGFGRSSAGRKRWWQRHHRNYYRVKTDEGEIYEIYYDRGVNKKNPEFKKWFITQRL
jgi:hypothetical protein